MNKVMIFRDKIILIVRTIVDNHYIFVNSKQIKIQITKLIKNDWFVMKIKFEINEYMLRTIKLTLKQKTSRSILNVILIKTLSRVFFDNNQVVLSNNESIKYMFDFFISQTIFLIFAMILWVLKNYFFETKNSFKKFNSHKAIRKIFFTIRRYTC